MLFVYAIAALLALWFFLAWYAADDQPILGPNKEGRVTAKALLQKIFKGIAEIFEPVTQRIARIWLFIGPRITNRALWAAGVADIAVIAGGEHTLDFLARAPWVGAAIIALNLLTPLTPNGAPQRIPA